MKKVVTSLLIATAGLLLTVSHGAAQSGLSEAEIAEKFAKQKTRGLTIAPMGTDSGKENVGATAAAADAYNAIPADEQVNINIRFDFDSAALREDQKPQLTALCNVLKSGEISRLMIVGHTDGTGTASYNERLSLLRAEEVMRYLSGNCSIAADRMQAIGVGSRHLLDANDPKGEVNRRVEFQAVS